MGPVHPLTRQPVVDRKRFGGIKFGDGIKCKNIASVIQRTVPGVEKIRDPYCKFCESGEEIVRVNVPYAVKLLAQQLFNMGITMKFETELG
ncbi:hypothetical protein Vadar_007230 [Vaccinium darrowii]|uniref:Uncharacterized protein n=1 Tax=Vaccinium darrowii TaxID=229202 RepID=A0ACB7WZ06_9ERIC|nr:hypothetical protein Vadar_007230 [Vaccinium darrowii]